MNRSGVPLRTRMRSPSFRAKTFSTCTRSPTARGSSHASHYVMGRCCLLFNGTRSAPRNWTRFAAQYLARGLPCERFTSPLAGRCASLGVGAVGYSLPRGGLSPPILCQLNWRTPRRVISVVSTAGRQLTVLLPEQTFSASCAYLKSAHL